MKDMLLNDLKDAMRSKDERKKDTVTMLRAAILQIEKDEQRVLTDDEIQVVVSKEVKKRKEAIPDFEKGDRMDIVESLNKEIEILSKYLPEQLTEEQVRNLVKESIALTGASTPKDMGKVMQDLRSKTSGKADGKLVSDIVKELLM